MKREKHKQKVLDENISKVGIPIINNWLILPSYICMQRFGTTRTNIQEGLIMIKSSLVKYKQLFRRSFQLKQIADVGYMQGYRKFLQGEGWVALFFLAINLIYRRGHFACRGGRGPYHYTYWNNMH